MTAPLDDKFREVDEVTAELSAADPEPEPTPLPPIPEFKIRGMKADLWATQIERDLSDERRRAFEAQQGVRSELESVNRHMREGFDLLGKQLLPTVQKLEERQADHAKQLAEHTRLLFALGDRQNEIVERQESLEARITAVETAMRKPAPKKRPVPGGKKKR